MTAPALYNLLVQAATAAAGEGGKPAGVYPIMPPEGMVLSISYMFAGGQSSPNLSSTGPQRRRVQVDVRSGGPTASAIQAWTLRDALIAFLDGYKGTLTDGTVVNVFLVQPLDGFENDARQYRAGAEFYFNFC